MSVHSERRTFVYRGASGGAEVVLYVIEGGGHMWPGGYQWAAASILGPTSRDINACDVVWDFFKRHRRGTPQP